MEYLYRDGQRQGIKAYYKHMSMKHINNLTNEEKAYLAGLFDGEGSINIFRTQRKDRIAPTYFVEISLGNTHRGVLEWVHGKFGGRVTHNAEHIPIGIKEHGDGELVRKKRQRY